MDLCKKFKLQTEKSDKTHLYLIHIKYTQVPGFALTGNFQYFTC